MVTADRPLIHIESGSSSHCYSDGKTVLKVDRVGRSFNQAEARLEQLKAEYQAFRQYLGDYVHPTTFSIEEDQGWKVNLMQTFVTGQPLRQSLNTRLATVQDFFGKALDMYSKTGLVPDLLPDIMPDPTGGMVLTGRYQYRSNANVLLTENEPLLIDTTLNRSLRNKITGPLLSALVARRIQSLLR